MPTFAAPSSETLAQNRSRRSSQAPPKSSPRSSPVSSLGSPIIQRKASCACGGGCSRCQAKANLTMSPVTDPAELEADAIADKVMRMPVHGVQPAPNTSNEFQTIYRQCDACREQNKQASQRKALPSNKGTSEQGSVHVQRAINSGGHPLNHQTRRFFEPRFGMDLGHVRVHTDSIGGQSARSIHARAYTLGSHIVFGSGEYQPESESGRHLLAHELTHVLQQGSTDIMRRKPLSEEEKAEDLQSPELKDTPRLQEAFDNAPEMKKNEASEGVKTLQLALRELGYPLPISFAKTGDADGIFGKETLAQVKQFQRDNGLTDNGIVERNTLRALDEKFNPAVTIEKVFIGDDHRDLVGNEIDWSDAGAKYTDWTGAPYHIVFDPSGSTIPMAIPVSVTAGKEIGAIAKVNIKGGIPGRNYSVRAAPSISLSGWTLSGDAVLREGFDTDYVFLSAEAPLPNKLSFREFGLQWETTTTVATRPQGESRQRVFVTSGSAYDVDRSDVSGDHPNRPTFKRLRQALHFAAGVTATQADRIVYEVFREFPNYGVCDAPTSPNSYGITCPTVNSVWDMSDHVSGGNFQCIAISRYVNAVLSVLGVPKVLQDILAKPVVIWATEATKETGIESDFPHPGINIPSIVHPRHHDWILGLLDGNCGVNNYEACIKLQWTPPGRSARITQYYCGGLGEENPREGFKTPREVLDSAFVLAYFVYMRKNDPNTGFPRGIRKKDVKVYNESGGCHKEL